MLSIWLRYLPGFFKDVFGCTYCRSSLFLYAPQGCEYSQSIYQLTKVAIDIDVLQMSVPLWYILFGFSTARCSFQLKKDTIALGCRNNLSSPFWLLGCTNNQNLPIRWILCLEACSLMVNEVLNLNPLNCHQLVLFVKKISS